MTRQEQFFQDGPIATSYIERRSTDGYPCYRGPVIASLPEGIRSSVIRGALTLQQAAETHSRQLLEVRTTEETPSIRAQWQRYYPGASVVYQTIGGEYEASSHRVIDVHGNVVIIDISLLGAVALTPAGMANVRDEVGKALGFDLTDPQSAPLPVPQFGGDLGSSGRITRAIFVK